MQNCNRAMVKPGNLQFKSGNPYFCILHKGSTNLLVVKPTFGIFFVESEKLHDSGMTVGFLIDNTSSKNKHYTPRLVGGWPEARGISPAGYIYHCGSLELWLRCVSPGSIYFLKHIRNGIGEIDLMHILF